jgi:L-amino acid N-acyltransferase YncA
VSKSMKNLNIVECTFSQHAEAVLEIFNEAILQSTVLFEYEPRTITYMEEWFAEKMRSGFPIIGIEEEGVLLGFSTFGSFRHFPAYQHTVEHSVYVHRDHRGKGLARRLMEELLNRAEPMGVHAMIGVIDADNKASISLHEQMGFEYGGRLREVGHKFNRWLDVVFYQKILKPCGEEGHI